MSLEEKIIKLNKGGYTVLEISRKLKCDPNTVRYNLNPEYRKKKILRENNRNKIKNPILLKIIRFLGKGKKYKKNKNIGRIRNIIYDKIRAFCDYKNKEGKVCMNAKIMFKEFIEKYKDGAECYLTGEKINILETNTYQLDHKIPRSRGGSNTFDNLGITCSLVNKCKNNLTPEELFDLCEKILVHQGYKIEKPDNNK